MGRTPAVLKGGDTREFTPTPALPLRGRENQKTLPAGPQDDCKVAENPLVVSPELAEGSNHERILIARPSTSSGLTARAFGRLCNRPVLDQTTYAQPGCGVLRCLRPEAAGPRLLRRKMASLKLRCLGLLQRLICTSPLPKGGGPIEALCIRLLRTSLT